MMLQFWVWQKPHPSTSSTPCPVSLVPFQVVAQVFRHQLRTKVRSMICFGLGHQLWTEVRSMVCSCCAINIHATGFSQWLMTNYDERRIHSATIRRSWLFRAESFSGDQAGTQPSKLTFANRYSPFAIRCLPDLPICRPHHLPKDLTRQEPCPPMISLP